MLQPRQVRLRPAGGTQLARLTWAPRPFVPLLAAGPAVLHVLSRQGGQAAGVLGQQQAIPPHPVSACPLLLEPFLLCCMRRMRCLGPGMLLLRWMHAAALLLSASLLGRLQPSAGGNGSGAHHHSHVHAAGTC